MSAADLLADVIDRAQRLWRAGPLGIVSQETLLVTAAVAGVMIAWLVWPRRSGTAKAHAPRACAACGTRQFHGASFCHVCGTALNSASASGPIAPVPYAVASAHTPPVRYVYPIRQRPTWVVVWLTIFSLGLYWPVWFGQTWAELKRYVRDPGMRPMGHALSMYVPIYSWFRLHAHWTLINEQADASLVPTATRPSSAVMGAVLANFVFFPLPILIANGQRALNRIWSAAYGSASEKRASAGEWVMALALPLLWIGAGNYLSSPDARLPAACRGWSAYFAEHDRLTAEEDEFWRAIDNATWTASNYRVLATSAGSLNRQFLAVDPPASMQEYVKLKAQTYENYSRGFDLAAQGQQSGANSWIDSGDAQGSKADAALDAANALCAGD